MGSLVPYANVCTSLGKSGCEVTVVARVVRQFDECTETLTPAKVLVLPDRRRWEDVEDALVVVGVPLRALAGGPGLRPPAVEVVLCCEPLAAAELARAGGWREPAPVEPSKAT